MINVLALGAINTDLVATLERAPEAGETTTGTAFGIYGGGKGANQALAAARAGAATAILGALGQDDFGRQRIADLKADGIAIDAVQMRKDAQSGVALITVETRTGQNRIAYVPGATLTITPDEAARAVAATQPRLLLTTLELPPDAIARAVADAKALGATVILNATPEPELAAAHLAMIDTLIVNEPEAQILLGAVSGNDWANVARALQGKGPRNVIITLGAKGAVARFGIHEVAFDVPSVNVVDTTGAGDALCGAYAAAIAAGEKPEAALQFGITAGSLACTVMGAQRSMPHRAAILELQASQK